MLKVKGQFEFQKWFVCIFETCLELKYNILPTYLVQKYSIVSWPLNLSLHVHRMVKFTLDVATWHSKSDVATSLLSAIPLPLGVDSDLQGRSEECCESDEKHLHQKSWTVFQIEAKHFLQKNIISDLSFFLS